MTTSNDLDRLVSQKLEEAMPQGSGRVVKRGHECDKPRFDFPAGTVWQCDCGRRYRLTEGKYPHWEPTLVTTLSLGHGVRVGQAVLALVVLILTAVAFGPIALAVVYSFDWLFLYIGYMFLAFVVGVMSDI